MECEFYSANLEPLATSSSVWHYKKPVFVTVTRCQNNSRKHAPPHSLASYGPQAAPYPAHGLLIKFWHDCLGSMGRSGSLYINTSGRVDVVFNREEKLAGELVVLGKSVNVLLKWTKKPQDCTNIRPPCERRIHKEPEDATAGTSCWKYRAIADVTFCSRMKCKQLFWYRLTWTRFTKIRHVPLRNAATRDVNI